MKLRLIFSTNGNPITEPYKILERGSIKTQALASQLLRLVKGLFPFDVIMGILDDTLLPRQSTTAPGVAIRHEHSRKVNRPRFINAQCWVTFTAGNSFHIRRIVDELTLEIAAWKIQADHAPLFQTQVIRRRIGHTMVWLFTLAFLTPMALP